MLLREVGWPFNLALQESKTPPCVGAAKKLPNGTLEAARINVGRGAAPAM